MLGCKSIYPLKNVGVYSESLGRQNKFGIQVPGPIFGYLNHAHPSEAVRCIQRLFVDAITAVTNHRNVLVMSGNSLDTFQHFGRLYPPKLYLNHVDFSGSGTINCQQVYTVPRMRPGRLQENLGDDKPVP